MKIVKVKRPKMVDSKAVKAKLRDDEDDKLDSINESLEQANRDARARIEEAKQDEKEDQRLFEDPNSAPMLEEDEEMEKYAEGGAIAAIRRSGKVGTQAEEWQKQRDLENPSKLQEPKSDPNKDVRTPEQKARAADYYKTKPKSKEYESQEHKGPQGLAEGGLVQRSIVDAIMSKRSKSNEQVDIESNNEEQPNQFYEENREILKENYDDTMDDFDDSKRDRVSAIRKRMMAKR